VEVNGDVLQRTIASSDVVDPIPKRNSSSIRGATLSASCFFARFNASFYGMD
jgi:hypothetical protein